MDKDSAHFERVCLGAQSPDNETRVKAEKAYQQMRLQPHIYFPCLFRVLKDTKHANVRIFCCVMLRQDVKPSSNVWKASTGSLREQVKHETLILLKSVKDNAGLRTALTEVVGVLAARSLTTEDEEKTWPELPLLVTQLIQANNPGQVESGLTLAGTIAEYAIDKLRSNGKLLQEIHLIISKTLQTKLTDNNRGLTSLKVAASKALVSTLLSLEPKGRSTSAFGQLIPGLFGTIGEVGSSANDEDLSKLLEQAMVLVCDKFHLVLPVAPQVIELCVKIAAHKKLSRPNSRMALNIIVQVASRGRSNIKNLSIIRDRVIPVAFSFLKMLEFDAEEWASRGSTDFEEEDFRVGMETIDYLSCCLGEAFFPGLWQLLPHAFTSKEWVERHAGLMAICAACEGSAKEIVRQLEALVKAIIPLVTKDPHPRVRWAALNCIAHLCAEFSPALQQAFGRPLLEAIVSAMRNRSNPARVTAHATTCLVDFCAKDESHTIRGYLDEILPAIAAVFQLASRDAKQPDNAKTSDFSSSSSSKKASSSSASFCFSLSPSSPSSPSDPRIIAAAMGALAAVSGAADEACFARVYHMFMPVVMRVLQAARDHTVAQHRKQSQPEGRDMAPRSLEHDLWMQELVSNTVHCIGVLAGLSSRQMFEKDAKQVMTLLATLQQASGASSPCQERVLEAFTSISHTLKEGFGPYLTYTIPPLLRVLETKDEDVYHSVPEDEQEGLDQEGKEGYELYIINVRGLGRQRVAVNTIKIDEMASACLQLSEYARNLPNAFIPFLQESAKRIFPLVSYQASPRVRLPAVQAAPSIIACATSKAPSEGFQLLMVSLKHYARAIEEEVEPSYMEVSLMSLSEAIDGVRTQLSADTCESIDKLCCEVMKNSLQRRAEYKNRLSDESVDDEEREEIQGDIDAETKMTGAVIEVVKSLLRNTGNKYLNIFSRRLLGLFSGFLRHPLPALQNAGLCCLSDVMEVAGQNPTTIKYAAKLTPIAVQKCKSSDSVDVRHSAAYTLGVCAQILSRQEFGQYYRESVVALVRVIEMGSSPTQGDDHGAAADNAISALAKVAVGMGVEAKREILGRWLFYLPCNTDFEEAKKVHRQLCEFLSNEHDAKVLYGDGKRNTPKLLSVFAEVVERGEQIADQETITAIRRHIITLLDQLGPNGFEKILSMLDTEQRRRLQKVAAALRK